MSGIYITNVNKKRMVTMKNYAVIPLIIAFIMLTAPFAAFLSGNKTEGDEPSSEVFSRSAYAPYARTDTQIAVFNPNDNTVEKMDMRDYCIGVVAAEMPASYEIEALKAQALVALTYAQYVKDNNKSENGDIAADSSVNQGFLSESEMKERWGDKYGEYHEKICEAVDAVLNYRIYYDSKPIDALYHAISPGRTEDAQNVWGKDIPYLKSADSSWDKESPRYTSTTVFNSEQFKERCSSVESVNLSGDEKTWVSDMKKTDAGTVESIKIGGVTLDGNRVRTVFALRSSAFDLSYDNGYFTFKSYGYGHGVGMSQYGANRMASDGKKYSEIIAHYYKGVSIVNVMKNSE